MCIYIYKKPQREQAFLLLITSHCTLSPGLAHLMMILFSSFLDSLMSHLGQDIEKGQNGWMKVKNILLYE